MRLGRPAQSLEQLARALALAEPGGFTRTFVDLGPELARLLGALARHGVATDYIGRLLGEFAAQPRPPAGRRRGGGAPRAAQAQLVEPLTERELGVVRLLGQRLSYAEIAAELAISPSTVKTHVNHIHGKLGASGRKEAIVQRRPARPVERRLRLQRRPASVPRGWSPSSRVVERRRAGPSPRGNGACSRAGGSSGSRSRCLHGGDAR